MKLQEQQMKKKLPPGLNLDGSFVLDRYVAAA